MRLWSATKSKLSLRQGFTLVEMLVIAPIAILVIGAVITFMVSLAGDSLIARNQGAMAFSIQNAQSRIEQDARMSTQFLDSFTQIDAAAQSKDGINLTSGFSTSGGDIILNQLATDQNPNSPNRNVIYYKNRPNACGTNTTYLNQALSVKVIYTIANYDGTGNALWRRTIVPSWSAPSSPNTDSVCATPWQRDSCKFGSTNGAVCQTIDEKILPNVSSMNVTYYLANGSQTTNVRQAQQLRVALTTASTTAGETVTNYSLMRARHINAPVDDIPASPNVYINNPNIASQNNTILATFAWDAVRYANYYNISWRLNGGAWQLQNNVTTLVKAIDKNSFPVGTVIGANDLIEFKVTAVNDQGSSPDVPPLAYRLPLWTVANLEGDFYSYGSSAFGQVRFTRTSKGLIMVDGLAASPSQSSGTITTLPVGFRPAISLAYPAWCSANAFCRVHATLTGAIEVTPIPAYGSTTTWVSMSAIRYLASDVYSTSTVATMGTGYGLYSSGTSSWGKPYLNLDSCARSHTNGLISTTTSWTTATNRYFTSFPSTYAAYGAYWPYPAIAYSTGVYKYAQLGLYASGTPYNIVQNNSAALTTNSWLSVNAMVPATSFPTANIAALTPSSGWTSYGAGYYGPVWTRSASCDNAIILGGTIKGTTTGQAIAYGAQVAQLPVGVCPSKRLTFMTVGSDGNNAPARIDIYPTGKVSVERAGLYNSMLGFANISFIADNPSCT